MVGGWGCNHSKELRRVWPLGAALSGLFLLVGGGGGRASYEAAAAGGWVGPTRPQVQLVLLIGPEAGLTAPHAWARALGQAGIRQVQIRQAGPADQPNIMPISTDPPVYRVTGILKGQEVVLPGARFRLSEVRQLAQWLDELALQGPGEHRPAKGPFGLRAEEFKKVHLDLAQPVGFSTRGMDRAEAVARIGQKLHFALHPRPGQLPGLPGDKVAEELSPLSCGTALAYLLRPAGYALVPNRADKLLLYSIERMHPGMELWPVGWPPEKRPHDLLPKLFEFVDVRLERISATQALQALADRLQVVYLLDHNALARHGIDPEKILVSVPASRTFYGKILDRVLFQAGLKYELRVDEAGTPVLWITTIKPL